MWTVPAEAVPVEDESFISLGIQYYPWSWRESNKANPTTCLILQLLMFITRLEHQLVKDCSDLFCTVFVHTHYWHWLTCWEKTVQTLVLVLSKIDLVFKISFINTPITHSSSSSGPLHFQICLRIDVIYSYPSHFLCLSVKICLVKICL